MLQSEGRPQMTMPKNLLSGLSALCSLQEGKTIEAI
jgi:hypothetical protein